MIYFSQQVLSFNVQPYTKDRYLGILSLNTVTYMKKGSSETFK